MSDLRTHYEVLDLPPDADAAAIRKRFRELAKRYHPDLHRENPEFNEIFLRVKQAYEVLNDPARRAHYDLDLRDRARRAQAGGATPSSGAAGATQYRPATSQRQQYEEAARQREEARRRDEEVRRQQAVARLLEDARIALARGHLRDAQQRCHEALQYARVGPAYEMLGDIASRQGRADEAIRHYTVAAQLQRNNGLVMAKLNRLIERQRQMGDDFDLPKGVPLPQPSSRLGYKMSVTCFGTAAVLFLMMWRLPVGNQGIGLPFAQNVTAGQLGLLGLAALVLGCVLASAGWIRPIDQELFYNGLGTARRSLPIGLLLAVFGAVLLPLALCIYLVISYLQQSISGSILTAILGAGMLALGFSLNAPPAAQMELLLVGANTAFLALLVGWFLGDLFRPNWAL